MEMQAIWERKYTDATNSVPSENLLDECIDVGKTIAIKKVWQTFAANDFV
jgi:hypothetical protein